jgi:transcriptional regulator GlxA family with amidase domain
MSRRDKFAEPIIKTDNPREIITFSFLLLKDFSLLSFSSLVEPLRMANYVANKTLYNWKVVTIDNQSVMASNTLYHHPTATLEESLEDNYLWLVSGINVHQHFTAQIKKFLKIAQKSDVKVCAASTATFLLAYAGLLKNKRCTVHWQATEEFSNEFPNHNMTGELYEVDGNILTCSGGLTCLDLILELIKEQQSVYLAKSIADLFLYPAIRTSDFKQKMSLIDRYDTHKPAIIKTLSLMSGHLEEVLRIEQLAQRVNISLRQLERLFKQQFNASVRDLYIHMRLERANLLLRESDYTIAEIGYKSGFSSASYFAKCYKKQYNHPPHQTRKIWLGLPMKQS